MAGPVGRHPASKRKLSGNGRPGSRSLWPLLVSEISLLFRRRRTWAMLAALAAVPVLIAVAVRLTHSTTPGRGPAFLDRITGNGLFVVLTALVLCTPLFLPLTVGVTSGDTIAGEAGQGTLRYLLVAPAGRFRLLVVKYVGAAVFAVAATASVVWAGTTAGLLLFPVGPVPLLNGDVVGPWVAGGRLLLVGGYVCVSLLGLSAIGLFISTLTDAPVAATAATVVLAICAQVLDALPQLDWLHPWLFSHYWLGFADLLRQPIEWGSFGSNALLQLGYLGVFGALAYGRFSTKDVLS
ncbi:ABC transporter permease [Arthrobacter alpinus]|uniref:ABC transporter permease n=1 Tax=Arthrobacter alpinus TaxID=656366 RepID=UPI001647074E|nr:ABC transporter permease [Arthrobacter alpinus]